MQFNNKILEIQTKIWISLSFCFTLKKPKLKRQGRLWTVTERKAVHRNIGKFIVS